MARLATTKRPIPPAPRTALSRLPQPRCSREVDGKTCNHPKSFHPTRRKGKCTALGCHCPIWSD